MLEAQDRREVAIPREVERVAATAAAILSLRAVAAVATVDRVAAVRPAEAIPGTGAKNPKQD
jgi:hypothetical protein